MRGWMVPLALPPSFLRERGLFYASEILKMIIGRGLANLFWLCHTLGQANV